MKKNALNWRARARALGLAAGIVIAAGAPAAASAATRTYTLDADFALGALDGVNYTDTANQLQLDRTGTTFPLLWIANAGEDTVSKIDTSRPSTEIPSGGCETARYRTWFNSGVHGTWNGPAPSRTAVDIEGNVYVANRHFEGRPASVLKILATGGIDRNGNGKIDTSADLNGNCRIDANEIVNLVDTNGNGVLDDAELADERVAWVEQVGAPNGLGRALCIGTQGEIWLGLYNSRQYYRLDPSNGSVVAGPISTGDVTPYGCLVDQQGRLWSASLTYLLGELDTLTNTWTATRADPQLAPNYGIALGNGKVYTVYNNGWNRVFDPATNVFSNLTGTPTPSFGVSVDGDGNVVLGQTTVRKYQPNGTVVWTSSNPNGSSDNRGVVVDQGNNLWLVNLNNNSVTKIRGSDGQFLGVLPVGVAPYTYSDATGFAARNVTTPTGTWTVVQDGGTAGTAWGKVSWNATTPAGSSVLVEVRAADTVAGLELQTYAPATNGASFAATGRYLQARVRLTASQTGETPVVFDVTLQDNASGLACDVDRDGDVDRNDVNSIMAARGQRASGPDDARDYDKDGLITVNDGRACVLRCTRTNCAL
jgi:hypothetical protein